MLYGLVLFLFWAFIATAFEIPNFDFTTTPAWNQQGVQVQCTLNFGPAVWNVAISSDGSTVAVQCPTGDGSTNSMLTIVRVGQGSGFMTTSTDPTILFCYNGRFSANGDIYAQICSPQQKSTDSVELGNAFISTFQIVDPVIQVWERSGNNYVLQKTLDSNEFVMLDLDDSGEVMYIEDYAPPSEKRASASVRATFFWRNESVQYASNAAFNPEITPFSQVKNTQVNAAGTAQYEISITSDSGDPITANILKWTPGIILIDFLATEEFLPLNPIGTNDNTSALFIRGDLGLTLDETRTTFVVTDIGDSISRLESGTGTYVFSQGPTLEAGRIVQEWFSGATLPEYFSEYPALSTDGQRLFTAEINLLSGNFELELVRYVRGASAGDWTRSVIATSPDGEYILPNPAMFMGSRPPIESTTPTTTTTTTTAVPSTTNNFIPLQCNYTVYQNNDCNPSGGEVSSVFTVAPGGSNVDLFDYPLAGVGGTSTLTWDRNSVNALDVPNLSTLVTGMITTLSNLTTLNEDACTNLVPNTNPEVPTLSVFTEDCVFGPAPTPNPKRKRQSSENPTQRAIWPSRDGNTIAVGGPISFSSENEGGIDGTFTVRIFTTNDIPTTAGPLNTGDQGGIGEDDDDVIITQVDSPPAGSRPNTRSSSVSSEILSAIFVVTTIATFLTIVFTACLLSAK